MYFIGLSAILIFQLLFALGLGLITRKISYAYYAGFLVMMGVYNYLRFQAVHQWSAGPEELLLTLAPIFPFLAYFFYFRFVRFFLELPQLSPPLARLARWLEWLSLSYVLVFGVLLFGNIPNLRLGSYFLIASALALGTIVLQVRMIRFRLMIVRLVQVGSLFYFLGMMTGFVGKLIETLGQPAATIKIDYMSLGLLVEITFFALALAYKLRQEAQEKQQVQERALQQLQKIQDLNLALKGVQDNLARDLHDDIGSTLGTISLLGALAGEQLSAAHPASPLVQQIGEYARSMGESMNDAIWALNTQHDRGEALRKRMEDFAAVLLTHAGLSYRFETDPLWHNQTFPMQLRKNLYLIFKESLYNIVRHAQARSVSIRLGSAPGALVLVMEDNGCGLQPDPGRVGNGLVNMRKRAEESGLDLQFRHPATGGLRIWVNIPLPLLREAFSVEKS